MLWCEPPRCMNEERILQAWTVNAAPWAEAVQSGTIASRVNVTNQAVLQAVGEGPGRLLDLGCGEGWLARELGRRGWEVLGVDGAQALVDIAERLGGAEYLCLPYEGLEQALEDRLFECVVANFSLLGDQSTADAIAAAGRLLVPGGRLVLQTVHPCWVDDNRHEGWREETWQALGALACTPSPWYYRNLGSWLQLFKERGLSELETKEPTAPGAEQPASLIILGRKPILDEPRL